MVDWQLLYLRHELGEVLTRKEDRVSSLELHPVGHAFGPFGADVDVGNLGSEDVVEDDLVVDQVVDDVVGVFFIESVDRRGKEDVVATA